MNTQNRLLFIAVISLIIIHITPHRSTAQESSTINSIANALLDSTISIGVFSSFDMRKSLNELSKPFQSEAYRNVAKSFKTVSSIVPLEWLDVNQKIRGNFDKYIFIKSKRFGLNRDFYFHPPSGSIWILLLKSAISTDQTAIQPWANSIVEFDPEGIVFNQTTVFYFENEGITDAICIDSGVAEASKFDTKIYDKSAVDDIILITNTLDGNNYSTISNVGLNQLKSSLGKRVYSAIIERIKEKK